MDRREFAGTVLAFGLVEMLWARGLFAGDVKPSWTAGSAT